MRPTQEELSFYQRALNNPGTNQASGHAAHRANRPVRKFAKPRRKSRWAK